MIVLPTTLTLEGEGVTLRDWRPEDAPALRPACGDPEVCRFTSVPWTYTEAAARRWIDRHHEVRAEGRALILAITRDGEPPAGVVNLVRFGEDGRSAALGYWIAEPHRNAGLASAAARTLAAWGFAELGLDEIELVIAADNVCSQRVAERLGARRVGAVSHPDRAGRAWPMVAFALTARPSPRSTATLV